MKRITYLVAISLTLILSNCKRQEKPYACFIPPGTIAKGISVTFNSNCSEYVDEFNWDFGDGNTSTVEYPSHVYEETGTYTVTLSVKNKRGKDSFTEDIEVVIPDEIRHITQNITEDETWSGGAVHHVTRDLFIDGATLTIEPGATVKIGTGKSIYIGFNTGYEGAALIAEGTTSDPIVITTGDSIGTPGAWDYIKFCENSTGSSLKYCNISYGGGYSKLFGSIDVCGADVSIDHCKITNSENIGISCDEDATFNSFSNNDIQSSLYPVSLYSSNAHTLGSNNTYVDNGILIHGAMYSEDEKTWTEQGTPYIIDGNMVIESNNGASLTITEGTKIQMTNGSAILVGYHAGTIGTLTIQGTASKPVVFSSADTVKEAGDWNYIGFYSGNDGSSLANVKIQHGGKASNKGAIYLEGTSISLNNSTIDHSANYGIYLDDESFFTEFSNNTITNTTLNAVRLNASQAHTLGTGNQFDASSFIELSGGKLESESYTWNKQSCPYLVKGDVFVASSTGSTLTLSAGTTLSFDPYTSLLISNQEKQPGGLVAVGTSGNPVIFTSAQPVGSQSAGDWDGVVLYDNTLGTTKFEYCQFSYGGKSVSVSGNIICYNTQEGVPVISNCSFSNSMGFGIYKNSTGTPTTSSNTFSNNLSGEKNF